MANINHTQTNVEVLLLQVARLLEYLEANSISEGYFLPVSNDGVGEIPIPPANSIYYNTTTSKLNYRDFSNVDHDLY
jgi:hypothetical protein